MTTPPPDRPPALKRGSLRAFLPLNDTAVSTRGQKLPGLIQNRSTSNIKDWKKRRQITIEGDGDNEARDVEGCRDGVDIKVDSPAALRKKSVMSSRRGSAMSEISQVMNTPQMRSMRLIGKNNPRYDWEKHYKSDEELRQMKKPIREYHQRNNRLIQSYIYIDRLLDSSLPHDLLQEYNEPENTHAGHHHFPSTPNDPTPISTNQQHPSTSLGTESCENGTAAQVKVKRTPKALYKLPHTNEQTPLLGDGAPDRPKAVELEPGDYDDDDDDDDDADDSNSSAVTTAIYINLAANALLLAGKIAVIALTSSLSVLASLVDAALDFLSTAIVWTTTKLIQQPADRYAYPVGRQRLEPIGVLVFSVIMIVSFFQVLIECLGKLTRQADHEIVQLGIPSIVIMALTVVIKLACWLWCRLIPHSSGVQALAQDALTDVVFNTFSIIFPMVGFYARIWWLDALGGLILSLYVIINWSRTSTTHIRHLTGAAAPPEDANILLYLTMRFAKCIKSIQGCQAYHAGDKLNVEVDVVLDEKMTLRDSHDLGESLQYVLESVPSVDRAFVHLDYKGWNLPSHMSQQAD